MRKKRKTRLRAFLILEEKYNIGFRVSEIKELIEFFPRIISINAGIITMLAIPSVDIVLIINWGVFEIVLQRGQKATIEVCLPV